VLLLAVLLLQAAKMERRTVLKAVGFFGLSLAGLLVSLFLAANGLTGPAYFLRFFSILGEGMCLISLVGVAVFSVFLPAMRLRSPRILHDLIVGIAYIVWGLIWLRANRVDLTSIIATSAIVTAVIGISLQDTLGNILGGVAIHLDQSVQVGDWIRVDDVVGRVVEVRWRYTSLETRTWETVIIPNGLLLKNRFSVLGRRRGEPVQWRRSATFQVPFEVPPTRVVQAIEEGLRGTEIRGVAHTPSPDCQVVEFGDSAIRYAARYWLTDLARDEPTDTLVRTHVYFALRRAGIPMSIPAQSIHLIEETEERRALQAERSREERIGALRQVDFFSGLQPEELRRLAEALTPCPFARGEVITRQGAPSDGLFILVDGKADVLLENDAGNRVRVAELAPGSVFGEMGLMTGEPRSATVVAHTEVECFRLGKEAFEEVLRSRPSLAEEISSMLAQRRVGLEVARETLDAEARTRLLTNTKSDILGRIRRFFSLHE